MHPSSDREKYIGKNLLIPLEEDLQNTRPAVPIALNQAGVVSVTKPIFLDKGCWTVTFDLEAELSASQAGVHMSRFNELLDEMLSENAMYLPVHMDLFAEKLAKEVVEKQQSVRAHVNIYTTYSRKRWAPVSGKPTYELYGLLAEAVATPTGTRKLIGVEVEGMVACPCAQGMVKALTRLRLQEAGMDASTIDHVLNVTPLATHNQRGKATLLIGTQTTLDIDELITIVENAMSSENYGLLKRPDELYIVNKAHARPQFAEDVVRSVLGKALLHFPDLPDDTFISVHQRNEETIHKYDVRALAWGTFGELREEIQGRRKAGQRTSLDAWLGQAQ